MQSFVEFIFKMQKELCAQTFVTYGQINKWMDRQTDTRKGQDENIMEHNNSYLSSSSLSSSTPSTLSGTPGVMYNC
jgi:hypothetical protein